MFSTNGKPDVTGSAKLPFGFELAECGLDTKCVANHIRV